MLRVISLSGMLSKENGQKIEYLDDLNPCLLCLIVFSGFATEFKDYANRDHDCLEILGRKLPPLGCDLRACLIINKCNSHRLDTLSPMREHQSDFVSGI